MINRVLPGASYVEIIERKKKVGRDLRAAIYLYRDKFIATSISGCVETGAPTVLDSGVADAVLGEIVCDHLLQFESRTPREAEFEKLTDWGAYKASGASSVKSFESHCWMVHLSTIGDNSVVASACPRKSLHDEIKVEGVARPVHAQVGSTLRRALACAQSLRAQGLV